MKILNFEFDLVHQNPYASLYYNEEFQLAICKADQDYIPIAHFKSTFLFVSEMIKTKPIKHFAFDKRNLRTFHQPSMEWYFAVWKPEVKTEGLIHHYKILPSEPWFAKSVQAGKHEIFQKYGEDIVEGITITYVNTLEDVLETIQKTN